MEQYFASQKDNIFRNVEVLIYVFDVESRELDNDMHYYQSCLEAIYKVCIYCYICIGIVSQVTLGCDVIASRNLQTTMLLVPQNDLQCTYMWEP